MFTTPKAFSSSTVLTSIFFRRFLALVDSISLNTSKVSGDSVSPVGLNRM
jgi:hypothetical protein